MFRVELTLSLGGVHVRPEVALQKSVLELHVFVWGLSLCAIDLAWLVCLAQDRSRLDQWRVVRPRPKLPSASNFTT